MGTTVDAIAGGASEWLRQGKSVAETNNLLKQSSILSVVGGMDSSAASEAFFYIKRSIRPLLSVMIISNLLNCGNIFRDLQTTIDNFEIEINYECFKNCKY